MHAYSRLKYFYLLSAIIYSWCIANSSIATTIDAESLSTTEQKQLLIFHSGIAEVDDLLVEAFEQEFSRKLSSRKLELINIDDLNQIQLKNQLEKTDHCVVTIGLNALEKALISRTKTPIFSTLVSRTKLDNLVDIYKDIGNPITGIYQEQPLLRQILLSKSINSRMKNIALILSRQNRYRLHDYKTISSKESMLLKFNILKLQESPSQVLSRLQLQDSFLLLLNDERHFSENNLRSLLVTSYKNQIPIIGSKFSDSEKLALASVYTPINALASESAAALVDICENKNWVQPNYAHHFKVQINQQIAKLLDYSYVSSTELEKKIIAMEQNRAEQIGLTVNSLDQMNNE